MKAITAKVGKHNGRPLGAGLFLNASIIETLGIQSQDYVTFSVSTEPGKIILTVMEAEK